MNLAAVLLLVIAPLGAPQAASAPAKELFAEAQVAPDDVRMFVHIEDVQALRSQLEAYPIAEWAGQFLVGGQFLKAWGNIAQLAGVNDTGLLDMVIGNDLTLMIRGSGKDLQWVLMTPLDDEQATLLFKKVKAQLHHSPGRGISMCILPDQRLILARTQDGMLFVCPQFEQGLMQDVLRRYSPTPDSPPQATLAASVAIKATQPLGPGQAGVFIAHDEPLGGWSVATLDFRDGHVRVRHRARFGKDAFVRPVPEHEIDPSLVENFADMALFAIIEPTDIGRSGPELFIQQQLLGGLSLISQEIRENLGDVRVFVLGDVEGRLQERQADMLMPTGAMCLKLKNADVAEKQLDEHLIALSERLNQMGQGAFVIKVPNRRSFIPGDQRQIDLDSFTDWVGNGMPLLNNVDLCWQTVDSPNGTFAVIATHKEALEETKRALEKACTETVPKGRWSSCGVANGVRIGRNLESLITQVDDLAAPGQEKDLEATLKLMSSLAFGIKQVFWKMARPCGQEMELDVDIELAPPVSAKDE